MNTGLLVFIKVVKCQRAKTLSLAMLSATGPLPFSLQQLNSEVWNKWYPEHKDICKAEVMIEAHSAGDMQSKDYSCGIWIPVIKQDETEIVSSMTISGIL